MSVAQPDLRSNDYYKVLGVAKDATDSEITKVYKRLALKCHPDKNQDNREQAEENFKKVSEAYSTLSDAEKRKEYDLYGKDGMRSGPGFANGGASGMSAEEAQALFGALFGGRGGIPSGLAGLGGVAGGLNGLNMMFGSGAAKRKRVPRQSPSYAIARGTRVVIRGLNSAPEHNGTTGTINGFDAARSRYEVALEGGREVLSLRPQNLTQQCSIEVTGLLSKPELNGTTGNVLNYDEDTGRVTVELQGPSSVISLQRGNCMLKEGVCVVLQGLSITKFNGQMAQIKSIDRNDNRYTVHCQNGEQIKVRFDKVIC